MSQEATEGGVARKEMNHFETKRREAARSPPNRIKLTQSQKRECQPHKDVSKKKEEQNTRGTEQINPKNKAGKSSEGTTRNQRNSEATPEPAWGGAVCNAEN